MQLSAGSNPCSLSRRKSSSIASAAAHPATLSGSARSRFSSKATIPCSPTPRRATTSPKSPSKSRGQHSAFTPSAHGVLSNSEKLPTKRTLEELVGQWGIVIVRE